METPHSHAVMQILREWSRVPVRERDSWLSSRCGDDAELLAAVKTALAAQDSATMPGEAGADVRGAHGDKRGHEKDAQPSVVTEMYDDAPARPTRIGRYTILGQLGEGGMGMVYLAEQERPKRRVALKVVRPGLVSARLLKRFELEAQMLGRLQHPGIAQIYEAGTADAGGGPQPFFAMELVEGRPLRSYCVERDLPIRARLELFVKVCEAVHHAHQKGVIHRDLKPGNILVDTMGQPKVLDFGVSRAIDADAPGVTMQTDIGQIVGTIPYMSPEQIGGDPGGIDTRSDVYTLGVILYELLAGRLPHALSDKTIPEAARIIGEQEPTPLSAMDASLRGDVQTIVAKSLEKDKERRYQSASEFGEDVGRYLRDEPILARPPSATYQMSKFAKRNKALVAGVAASVALLVMGVIGTAWQAARATDQRNAALKAEAFAKEQAETAEEINGVLTSMLSMAMPEQALGREVTVREVVDTAAAGLDGRFADRPNVEYAVRDSLGETYRSIGELAKSQAQYERVLELMLRVHGPEHRQTMQARRNVAGVLADRGKHDEAEKLSLQIVADCTKLYGADDFDTAMAGMELGRIYQETGRWPEAEPLLRQAIVVGKQTRGERDQFVITAIHNLGTALKDSGSTEEAASLLREALVLRKATLGDTHPETLFTMNNLAATLQRSPKLEDHAEAQQLMRETLAARERVLGPDHISTTTTVSNLAASLVEDKKLEEALPLATRAYETWRTTLGEEHAKTMIALGNLAYLYEDLGRVREAEEMYRRAIAIRKKASGGRDPETWAPMNNLAMLLMKDGKLEEADKEFAELMSLCEATLPPDHVYPSIFRNNYGECLTREKRLDDAERALTRSHGPIEKQFGPTHPRTVTSLTRLATLYDAKGDGAKAAEYRARLPK